MIGNQKTIDALKQRYPMVDLFFKVEHADVLPEFLKERWTPPATGDGCVDFGEEDASLAEEFSDYASYASPQLERPLHWAEECPYRAAERCCQWPFPCDQASEPYIIRRRWR
jgi:hypothetical protein